MIDRFTDLVLYNCNFEDLSVGTGLAYYKDISKVFYKNKNGKYILSLNLRKNHPFSAAIYTMRL